MSAETNQPNPFTMTESDLAKMLGPMVAEDFESANDVKGSVAAQMAAPSTEAEPETAAPAGDDPALDLLPAADEAAVEPDAAADPEDGQPIPYSRFTEVLQKQREAEERAEKMARELDEYRQRQTDERVERLLSMELEPSEVPDGWEELPERNKLLYVADLIARQRLSEMLPPEDRKGLIALHKQRQVASETGLRDIKQIDAVLSVLTSTKGLTTSDALTLARTRNPGLFDGGQKPAVSGAAVVPPKGATRLSSAEQKTQERRALEEQFFQAGSREGQTAALLDLLRRG